MWHIVATCVTRVLWRLDSVAYSRNVCDVSVVEIG